ncbi:hypothetical protein Pmani_012736 [Petrolisthes manimaculis]|uniref:Uncharacterized protein n=1 Tax=Petrolisthes manimaculis TaxID=1843537 RepID=A0AAE1Q091_9EUCA|nr:hypothetical protein Pmani_012736 [Petrolisthes manimaculis]
MHSSHPTSTTIVTALGSIPHPLKNPQSSPDALLTHNHSHTPHSQPQPHSSPELLTHSHSHTPHTQPQPHSSPELLTHSHSHTPHSQ